MADEQPPVLVGPGGGGDPGRQVGELAFNLCWVTDVDTGVVVKQSNTYLSTSGRIAGLYGRYVIKGRCTCYGNVYLDNA